MKSFNEAVMGALIVLLILFVTLLAVPWIVEFFGWYFKWVKGVFA